MSKILLCRKPSRATLYDIFTYSTVPSTSGDVTKGAMELEKAESKTMLVKAVVSQRESPLYGDVSKMDSSPYKVVSTEDKKGKHAYTCMTHKINVLMF